jgi:hypothetical protein
MLWLAVRSALEPEAAVTPGLFTIGASYQHSLTIFNRLLDLIGYEAFTDVSLHLHFHFFT